MLLCSEKGPGTRLRLKIRAKDEGSHKFSMIRLRRNAEAFETLQRRLFQISVDAFPPEVDPADGIDVNFASHFYLCFRLNPVVL